MSNEEALSVLKNQLQYARFTSTSSSMIPNDVVELAIDGIEKQIPKKVKTTKKCRIELSNEKVFCPHCGRKLERTFFIAENIHWCDYCGNAIDWGGVDDE